MVMGVGIDMIEVERVQEKISKSGGFRELVFAPAEIAYCEAKTNKYEHYAARFAAKEALLKALGTGWAGDLNFSEIVITNDEKGKPFISLPVAKPIESLQFARIHLSLSHLKSIASAVVIIETVNS
jgi:holo-[acyl-carrier protein] synthase